MAYVQRHSGFVAAVMLLSACGVAVEQAPQTNSAQRSADSANVITTPEPVIAAPAQQSARIDQAGIDADTDEAGGDGLIIDNIIASIESPESVPPPVPGAVTDTDPGEPVADPSSADEGEAASSGTETVLALLAPVIAESAARAHRGIGRGLPVLERLELKLVHQLEDLIDHVVRLATLVEDLPRHRENLVLLAPDGRRRDPIGLDKLQVLVPRRVLRGMRRSSVRTG